MKICDLNTYKALIIMPNILINNFEYIFKITNSQKNISTAHFIKEQIILIENMVNYQFFICK
jgi:hypothetical protein